MKLVDVYNPNGEPKVEAVDFLYKLLRERSQENDNTVNISHRKLPSLREHTAFVLSRPYCEWKLIEHLKEWVGYVSLTYRNEIGIVLLREHRGQGLGKKALALFLRAVKPLPPIPSERVGYFLANINPMNRRSMSLFYGAGFERHQVTLALKRREQ